MGANDASEMLQVAKEECLRLEGELERTRSIAAHLEADGARLQARIDAALTDEGVERAAKALWYDDEQPPFGPDVFTWEAMIREDGDRVRIWRDHARRIVAAALVSEEPAPEPPKLDPLPWVWPVGDPAVVRYSYNALGRCLLDPRERDEDGKPYSQNRADYGVTL